MGNHLLARPQLGITLYRCANSLTIGRMLAIPLVVFLLVRSQTSSTYRHVALALLVLLQGSDILDGFLARWARRSGGGMNPIGAILDPVADKLYLGTSYLTLALIHAIPLWIVVTIISRDLLLIVGWVIRFLLTGLTHVKPNALGKLADTCQAFLVFGFLLSPPRRLLVFGMVITALLTVASGIVYIWRARSEIRQRRL